MFSRKSFVAGMLSLIAMPLLTGCGGQVQSLSYQVRELKGRVGQLETQLGRHDESIRELRANTHTPSVRRTVSRRSKAAPVAPTTTPVLPVAQRDHKLSTRQVQIALRNAGHNPGSIDGKMGPRTSGALRSFQAGNGLRPSGRPDQDTMNKLADHL
jgi:peptidoglycan hydrolase-like protein with peptidoglycan-binding domain